MSIKANWQRGRQYFYVHASSLACAFLLGEKLGGPYVPLHINRPKVNPEQYHRCEIVVVRTKKEAAAVARKFAKMRKLREAAQSGEGTTKEGA